MDRPPGHSAQAEPGAGAASAVRVRTQPGADQRTRGGRPPPRPRDRRRAGRRGRHGGRAGGDAAHPACPVRRPGRPAGRRRPLLRRHAWRRPVAERQCGLRGRDRGRRRHRRAADPVPCRTITGRADPGTLRVPGLLQSFGEPDQSRGPSTPAGPGRPRGPAPAGGRRLRFHRAAGGGDTPAQGTGHRGPGSSSGHFRQGVSAGYPGRLRGCGSVDSYQRRWSTAARGRTGGEQEHGDREHLADLPGGGGRHAPRTRRVAEGSRAAKVRAVPPQPRAAAGRARPASLSRARATTGGELVASGRRLLRTDASSGAGRRRSAGDSSVRPRCSVDADVAVLRERQGENELRLSCSYLEPDRIEEGVARLAVFLRKEVGSGRPSGTRTAPPCR